MERNGVRVSLLGSGLSIWVQSWEIRVQEARSDGNDVQGVPYGHVSANFWNVEMYGMPKRAGAEGCGPGRVREHQGDGQHNFATNWRNGWLQVAIQESGAVYGANSGRDQGQAAEDERRGRADQKQHVVGY
jgi:hypothetical protein